MAKFTGTTADEQITPAGVSSTVTVSPAGRVPSADADNIVGGGGTDTVAGAGGNDTISFSGYGSNVRGDAGNDAVRFDVPGSGGAVLGTADGGDGADTMSFSVSQDRENIQHHGAVVLRGGEGNDVIGGDLGLPQGTIAYPAAGLGASMYGGGGNDQLSASTQITGSSYVPYEGGHNRDVLYGGTGDDTYTVQEQQDVVVENAGEGYDTVIVNNSSVGSYTLSPNVEKVQAWDWYWHWGCDLTGNDQANLILGTGTANTLNGMGGDDVIYGKPASYAYADGKDTLHGGSGNDLIYGGGSGSDTWDRDDTLYGDAGDDTLHGVIGNDAMFGGDGADKMFGGEGNDRMDGGAGNDDIRGQNGNDTLTGGAGLDRVMGGAGSDVFDYNATADSRPTATYRDVITTSFDGVGAGSGDRIDLGTIDANTGVYGNQAFTFRGTGAITGAGQIKVAASGTSTLIQANTGGSTAPELEILVNDGAALPGQWAAADFIL